MPGQYVMTLGYLHMEKLRVEAISSDALKKKNLSIYHVLQNAPGLVVPDSDCIVESSVELQDVPNACSYLFPPDKVH